MLKINREGHSMLMNCKIIAHEGRVGGSLYFVGVGGGGGGMGWEALSQLKLIYYVVVFI